MTKRGGGVPGDLLRRAAERVLSPRIMDSVVIPALADLQHESTLARTKPVWRRTLVLVRGYCALWAALTLCLASWPTRSLREDWSGSEAPGPRVVGALAPPAAVLCFILTLTSVTQDIHWARRLGDPWVILLLLLPSVVTVTAPIAFFLGLVLAVGRLSTGRAPLPPKRWLGSVVGLSIVASLCTFVFFGWVTPPANQWYRERVFRALHLRNVDGAPADRPFRALPKGTRELTLGELQTRIHEKRAQGQSSVALDVEWHKKWAIPAACLVLGPLAIGLQGLWKRPRTAMSFAYAVAAILLLYIALRLGEQAALAGLVRPLPAMWAGDVLLALVTLALLARAPHAPGGEAIRTYDPPSSGEPSGV